MTNDKITPILPALHAGPAMDCKKHAIDRGVVVDKPIIPSFVEYIPIKGWIRPVIRPAVYFLDVQNGDVTESFIVSRDQYYAVCIRDSVRLDKDKDKGTFNIVNE